MFDLNEYYEKAWTGVECGDKSIIPFINNFRHIILWGASTMGKAIGKKLLDCGVKIENYWDIRFQEIQYCNGIEVIEPYTTPEPDKCIVVVCIGNRVIIYNIMKEAREKGFENLIFGDYLYMGLLCPFNKETGINAKRCAGTMECRQVYCRRISGILEKHVKSENPIILPSVTFIINQRCSLHCMYCTSYMNQYKTEDRIDFPAERICEDIDIFFDLVDIVGTITVMGGEPFMHKDISKIIAHLCTKKNFGLISIATSGTYPITEDQLPGLYDPRVNVSFSNYTESITENQKKMFYRNIEFLKEKNICHTVGLFSPEWIVPPTLLPKRDEEYAMQIKEGCSNWHQIKNGKVHPCDLGMSIYSLGVADNPADYFDLTQKSSHEELKEKFRGYLERPFYECCKYHYYSGEKRLTRKAAEQGYFDFTKEQV